MDYKKARFIPPTKIAIFTFCEVIGDDATAGGRFGRSVAIQGDTLVVGTRFFGSDGSDFESAGNGSVYIFQWSGKSWIQQAKLTADDAAAWDQFGNSVAIDGNTVVVDALIHELLLHSGASHKFPFYPVN